MFPEQRTSVACVALLLPVCCAAEGVCYSSGGVAGIVVATIVVTVVVGGLAAAVTWYLWKRRTAKVGLEGATTACHDKKLIGQESDYAFDNPYFKDDDVDGATPDAAEKGEAGLPADNGDITPSQNAKPSNASKPKKVRPFSSLPFQSVFTQGSKKQRTMDDTFISKQPERIVVPLRGHDFTGLGFNICGNMRDGIFVKDVLHRGPASESGKIRAGDRILSVTVSFSAMVYEDALTILSYASPYDVRLELEKAGDKIHGIPTSSPGKRLGSASFRNGGQRLFHPLYRSQSIDDLTQIGKDGFPGINRASGGPKRSQSVEATTPKTKPQLKFSESVPEDKSVLDSNGSRKSSTSSEESLNKKLGKTDKTDSTKSKESLTKRSISVDVKHPEKVDEKCLKTEVPLVVSPVMPDTLPIVKTEEGLEVKPEELKIELKEDSNASEGLIASSDHSDSTEVTVLMAIAEQGKPEKPTVPPRKAGTPGKRKAPAPPRSQMAMNSTRETAAVVHQVEEDADRFNKPDMATSDDVIYIEKMEAISLSSDKSPEAELTKLEMDEADSLDTASIHDNSTTKADDNNSVSGDSLEASQESPEPSSPKRKASSLGDLTKLEEEGNKKSSTLLERAVSLDLQQQQCMPEDNLVRQKKILKPPSFNPEDTSEEDFQTVEKRDGALRRWDFQGSWDKLQESISSDSETQETGITPASSQGLWPSRTVDTGANTSNGHHVLDGEKHPSLEEELDLSETLDCANNNIIIPQEKSLSSCSISSSSSESETKDVTSTPARKVIEVDSFLKGNLTMAETPPPPTEKEDEEEDQSERKPIAGTEMAVSSGLFASTRNTGMPSLISPISINIPIIPPVIRHYEKLPNSPPALQSRKDSLDDSLQESDEVVTSSYKPVFLKQTKTTTGMFSIPSLSDSGMKDTTITETTEGNWTHAEDGSSLLPENAVNGNGSESSSFSQYRTAMELPSDLTSSTTTVSTASLLKEPSKKLSLPELSGITVHTSGGGFAKTLIISASGMPNEAAINLNAGSSSPPPKLEPPQ